MLLGWVHRVRDLGGARCSSTSATATASRRSSSRDDEALIADAKRLRSEFVVGVIGRVERRVAGHGQPEARDRRGRSRARARSALLNEAKTPPFPIADDVAGLRGDAAASYRYLDLRRPRLQHNIDPAPPRRRWRSGSTSTSRASCEIETPILDEVDARRRARLPRAEPRPPGRVLRAAAVAADLQADPDDCRHGPLLPDRALLPRRGPARRSAARVHAGRRRDVVRDARTSCSRSLEPLMERVLWRHRPRRRRRRFRACRTPRRSRSTGPTSRTCAAAWRSQDLSRGVRRLEFRVFRDVVADGRRRSAASSCRAGELLAQRARRARRSGEAARRRRAGLGAPRRRRACRARREGGWARRRSARRSSCAGAAPAICC